MKYIKKLFIFLFAIILSGCSATYELELKNNNIKEKLTVLETDSTLFDKIMDSGFTIREMFDATMYDDQFSNDDYQIKSLENQNQLGIEYKTNNLEKIINSSVLNQCYIGAEVVEDNENIIINTGDNFKCYEYYENLETIKISFKTNHDVIETNAMKIDGNEYIWNFDKNSDKSIKIIVSKDANKGLFSYIYIIFPIVVILSIAIVLYYIYIKRKQENNI